MASHKAKRFQKHFGPAKGSRFAQKLFSTFFPYFPHFLPCAPHRNLLYYRALGKNPFWQRRKPEPPTGRGSSPPSGGERSPPFFVVRTRMADNAKELSVFVDESGSFDSQTIPSRFYVVSLVFHDQSISIAQRIAALEESLTRLGLPALCFHAGPIIRREDKFRELEIGVRRKIFNAMTAFARTAPAFCKSFCVDKRYCSSPEAIRKSLVAQIRDYLTAHGDEFSKYECVKIYYDNGQAQVKGILTEVFKTLSAEFPVNVTPERYRLFRPPRRESRRRRRSGRPRARRHPPSRCGCLSRSPPRRRLPAAASGR